MKFNKIIIFLFLISFINIHTVFAQDFKVPKGYSFKTAEDFKKYEPDILKCIEYMENAPVNDTSNSRKKINSFLLEWLTDVPYIHITVNSAVMKLTNENAGFLLIFLGGWAKYSILNPDDKEMVNGYLAGIESILNSYRNGKGVNEDKAVLELIKIQENGKLREWVVQQTKK